MRLSELHHTVRDALAEAGVDGASLDARIFIRKILKVKDADFITDPDLKITADHLVAIQELAAQRIRGKPVSRILGEREFWGLKFTVTPAVLDPRPDTETLIEAALRGTPPARILDLGTGSGCILISLLHEWRKARGVAVDFSADALEIARQNAVRNKVAARMECVQGSWFEPLDGNELFDLIVSNPPYIPAGDIANLSHEVRNHDPILALSGGFDGFDSYKVILSGLKNHLSADGRALFEIGIGQADQMARLVENAGFTLVAIHPDLGGIPRVVELCRGDK